MALPPLVALRITGPKLCKGCFGGSDGNSAGDGALKAVAGAFGGAAYDAGVVRMRRVVCCEGPGPGAESVQRVFVPVLGRGRLGTEVWADGVGFSRARGGGTELDGVAALPHAP